jgi:hypothetical protein
MKSTIRSVAAVALSAVFASVGFAGTPTAGERNIDALNSWFDPAPAQAMKPASTAGNQTPAMQASAPTKSGMKRTAAERAATNSVRKEADSGMN